MRSNLFAIVGSVFLCVLIASQITYQPVNAMRLQVESRSLWTPAYPETAVDQAVNIEKEIPDYAAISIRKQLSGKRIEDLSKWKISEGDRFLVDIETNQGFLVHKNGWYYQFPIVTGQQRHVYYIGRSYFAQTPSEDWVVKKLDRKRPGTVTFGRTGRFFRLYIDGEKRTAYGIHGHRDAEFMINSNMRYRSMGCILVNETMLDVIQKTYEKNGEELHVQTRFGMDV